MAKVESIRMRLLDSDLRKKFHEVGDARLERKICVQYFKGKVDAACVRNDMSCGSET